MLAKRLAQISPGATRRLAQKFEAAKVTWPPSEVALVAIKDEKVLDLYARAPDGGWSFVHRYPVLAASGGAGPKLRQGDRQVPEGLYRITYLNPTSRYHVSLRLNYPNAFDRKMATVDGRTGLGGDIMIHGKKRSAGCLAVGDAAAEELFVLIAEVGKSRARVVIAPTDFRRAAASSYPKSPPWLPKLYANVASTLSKFPPPPRPSLLSLLWP
jgi:murein L,D-transpeptidase YafK